VSITDFVIEDSNKCKFCKSTNLVFDPSSSEKICSSCGAVLDIEYLSDQNTHVEGRDSMSALVQPDGGLSTLISAYNVDANGIVIQGTQLSTLKRIRKWNKISASNRGYHRNLNNAFAILIRIKEKLSVSEPIIEKAAYYYRKVLDINIIKGRSIKEFVVACVYAACRELCVPRTMEEIVRVANADKVFSGKCYRLLVIELKIHLPAVDLSSYLSRISNNAKISEKTSRRAVEMMCKMRDYPISYGKDPSAISVAILYGACLLEGEKISQGQLAAAGQMSIVTLRKRYLDVRSVFPDLPRGPTGQ
jgi:transcription initiation factor TFIIB